MGGLLLVTDYVGGTTHHWPAYDGNGNVAALVAQANGSLSARYEYGPFGEALRATGPMAKKNPLRFSTKYTDDQTGLLYYGYRYYNPTTGRWLNRDPIGERGGLNLYILLGNEPPMTTDALGLEDAWLLRADFSPLKCKRPAMGALDSLKRYPPGASIDNSEWYQSRFPGTLAHAEGHFLRLLQQHLREICRTGSLPPPVADHRLNIEGGAGVRVR